MNDIDQTALEIARAFIPVDVVGQQRANLQVAIIEAIKKHANPKTLADVQPGGRVRLGDQAERAKFEAWAESEGEGIGRWPDGFYIRECTQVAWESWKAALSAQPSPGGQGDWRAMLSQFGEDDPREGSRSNGHDGVDHNDWVNHAEVPVDVLARIATALAARQPVVSNQVLENVEQLGVDSDSQSSGNSGELPVDSQPVGEPVAWMTHHDDPMLFPTVAEAAAYCEDDEQPVPLFRSPAQAVDLGELRRLSDGWLARSDRLSATQQRKAGAYWACAKELRDWLDSQAVGK
ncbi:hypothetical protein [Stenotrophomonas forensis]|uniref:hypothetical protein n=1 Tax=Stenotrophomonas forensis TaxID=2871169 RepID=UPI0039C5EE4E